MLSRGVIAKERSIISVKPLVREDLAALREPRDTKTLMKLRDPHHRVARLVASGLRPDAVVARSGYSMTRYQTLKNDPAFKQLVAEYRKEVDKVWAESVDDFHEMAVSNMLKAERQIAEKLEEADELGETLPTRDLIAISRDAADRFGYGKKTTNTNINIDFAARLEGALKRSKVSLVAQEPSPRLALSPPPGPEPSPTITQGPAPLKRRA
jgi:hypothetical protein